MNPIRAMYLVIRTEGNRRPLAVGMYATLDEAAEVAGIQNESADEIRETMGPAIDRHGRVEYAVYHAERAERSS